LDEHCGTDLLRPSSTLGKAGRSAWGLSCCHQPHDPGRGSP